MMTYRSLLCLFVFLATIGSCRKNDTIIVPTPDSVEDKWKDTALAYARDIYLWNNSIPADFDARQFDDLDGVMTAIRQYSIEPGFSDPVDNFSFAMKQADWNNVSTGITSDFGLYAFFLNDSDLRVRSVEEASPAGKAGVRRGWKFVSVAGNNNISANNTDFLIENIYESPSTSFTFQKPDGSTVDITLSADTYQENPLSLDTIYSEGARKAGYLVFNSFLGDTAAVNAEFQQIFSRFVSEGVTDVIVDLRYNGGGYVNLQENLANYLVKTSADRSIMMNQEFNDNYSELNEVTRFRKKGSLDINNVYFIVSDNTASASELLINNLKPYMNVKLVGPEATYGKPVGFFPIEVGDWYIFPVSFRSTNGLGDGNYFDGIATDQVVNDGLDKDWGDREEAALATVLSHIRTGSFAVNPVTPGLNSTLETMKRENQQLLRQKFRGMIK